MPARPLSASVLVCAYTEQRLPVLEAALEAAAAQLGPADELLVVVDHNPALLATVQQRWGDRARVLENRGSQGLSGGRNTGVAAAAGEAVVFLDDDAVPEPGWLDALLAPYADPAVAGTGGAAVPCWQSPRPGWFPEEFLWVVGCTYRGIPDRVHDVRNPIGANMSFRREALLAAGPFAEGLGRVGTLPEGCEETELSIRLARACPGSRVVHVPGSRVQHHVTPQRTSWAYFAARCRAEGRSKAAVSRLQGSGAALSSERRYTTRVLPAAVLRGLAELLTGRVHGGGRAAAVVAGFLLTLLGYLQGLRTAPPRPAA